MCTHDRSKMMRIGKKILESRSRCTDLSNTLTSLYQTAALIRATSSALLADLSFSTATIYEDELYRPASDSRQRDLCLSHWLLVGSFRVVLHPGRNLFVRHLLQGIIIVRLIDLLDGPSSFLQCTRLYTLSWQGEILNFKFLLRLYISSGYN